jgi:hypothetical protein
LGKLLKEGALAHEDIVFWRARSIATAKKFFLYPCHHLIYKLIAFYRGLEAKSEEAENPKEFYNQEGRNLARICISLEEGKKIDLVNSGCSHLRSRRAHIYLLHGILEVSSATTIIFLISIPDLYISCMEVNLYIK